MKHTTANKLIKGLSLVTGTIALTGAVGQQNRVLDATDSGGLEITVDVKPFNLGAKEKKDIEDEGDAAARAED
jgi:hypothetical protein